MKQHHLILISLFIFSACQTNMRKDIKPSSPINPFDKNEWTSKLEKDTNEIMASWLGSSNLEYFSEKKYQDMGLNVFLEGENPSKMKVIPIVNYKISYQSFMNWNGSDPIETIMELSKNTADCYIANGSDIKCMVKLILKDNKWGSNGWGPMDKSTSKILSSIYFKKKENTINIYIASSSDTQPYQRIFIAYKENGKLMRIQNGGITSSLIPDLKEFQEKLKSGKEW